MSVNSIDLKPELKFYLVTIVGIELICFFILFKSVILSAVFCILILAFFLLYMFPELGFAIPFSINIVLYLLFDYVEIDIPVPAFTSYIVIIASSTALYLLKQDSEKKFEANKLFWISMVIGLILISGVLYSADKAYGIRKVFFYFTFNIPVFIVATLLKNNFRSIEKVLAFLFLIGIVIALLCYQVAKANILFEFVRFRLSKSIGPLYVARTLGLSSIAALYFIVKSKSILPRLLFIGSLILLVSPIIWS